MNLNEIPVGKDPQDAPATITCPHCQEEISELEARTITYDVHSIKGRLPDGRLDLEVARINPHGYIDIDCFLCPDCNMMIDEKGDRQDQS